MDQTTIQLPDEIKVVIPAQKFSSHKFTRMYTRDGEHCYIGDAIQELYPEISPFDIHVYWDGCTTICKVKYESVREFNATVCRETLNEGKDIHLTLKRCSG